MTKVTFFKKDGVYYGFEEVGHSGYADEGNDIVCAALSAMTMLIINAIEVSYSSDVDFSVDEESTDIRFIAKGALPDFESDEAKRYAIAGLIQAYYIQLNDMLEDYYEYLDIAELEEDPENLKK